MAAVRYQPLRHLTAKQSCQVSHPQRRWARVHDVRFVATHQLRDRILDKYRYKLDQKAKEEGLKDIDELKEAYKEKIAYVRKKAAVPEVATHLQPPSQTAYKYTVTENLNRTSSPSQLLARNDGNFDQITPTSPNYKPPGVKTLSSFIDIDKTKSLPQQEIKSIWRLRHAHAQQSLCASMTASDYSSIAATARKHPQFILPGLPRKDVDLSGESKEGAPIHFLQWTFPAPDTATVLFTHLAEYKLRGEFAQPHTTFTHHLEMANETGLVLCQGSVVEGRGISVEEGKWLIMCLQKFYNTHSTDGEKEHHSDIGRELKRRRRRLMEQFSEGDPSFNLEDLLAEAERLG